MSDQEAQSPNQLAQMKPYLIAATVLLVIVVAAVLWPTSDDDQAIISEPIAVTPVEPVMDEPMGIKDAEEQMPESDVFEGPREIKALEIEVTDDIEPLPEYEEPEPIDESDGAVKNSFVAIASSPLVAKYLVDESLLQKFVINVNSIATQGMAPKHNLVTAPITEFRVYEQADSQWIDAASFKRYNPYVEALESMETSQLINLLDTYRPIIEEKFAEISPPNTSFDETLMNAINELLDTPVVPLPIEVYSDSVMYKYKDEKLENLSAPQKQLLRTGPENTRRIQDVLHKLKDAMQE